MSWPWLHLGYDGNVCDRLYNNIVHQLKLIRLIYFQGKVVHQGLSIQSSFSQRVRLQQILSLTEDMRFYYKRLRSNRVELEPRRKTKVSVSFHQTQILYPWFWKPLHFTAAVSNLDYCISSSVFFSPPDSKYLFRCQYTVWWSLLCRITICTKM